MEEMSQRFTKLVDLMAALRAPNGCPWDRKQTHLSLRRYLLDCLSNGYHASEMESEAVDAAAAICA